MAYHVFISWSGRRSGLIAQSLAQFLENVFDASLKGRIFHSSRDIRSGAKWSERINQALRESRYGIVCLTPENKSSAWPLFEAGALSKTAGEVSVCPYLHDLSSNDLGRPLEQFNATTTTKEGTLGLVKSINASLVKLAHSEGALEAIFEYRWPELEQSLAKLPSLDSDTSLQASKLQQDLPQLISATRDRPLFRENPYLAHVICDALLRFKRSLETVGPFFDVPITLYPAHLVSLLERHQPGIEVKAVALVDATERFWPQTEGQRILKATPQDSSRIFVFHEREHLKANAAWLAQHAKRYNVYVASYKRLASIGSEWLKDFSIIGGNAQPLLAYYTESMVVKESGFPLKMIRFTTDAGELSDHQDAFGNMLRLSTRVVAGETNASLIGASTSIAIDFEDEESLDRLADSAFDTVSRNFQKKQVEMSSYIDVLEYDLHEEEHAYYCEMMEAMLEVSRLKGSFNEVRRRVLEFGAGTGLFTKRLSEIPSLDIVAVELDWACYHLLRLKMEARKAELEANGSKFTAENRDCRNFNPEGRFQCIFSSFADHHIFPNDKGRYFANVKRNLLKSGLFVVGDEFLPEHDESSPEARQRALRAYHGHIIDLANAQGFSQLAMLEQGALESGLRSLGDFKISCSHYEKLAKKHGLRLETKQKIGPKDRDDLGGIYVYVFSRQD